MKFEERIVYIKDNVEVSELIDMFGLEGKMDGDEFRMICPFHHDTDPSFSFNVGRKIFHCFGCDCRGDIITFVQMYKKFDFATALTFLESMIVDLGKVQNIVISDRILLRETLVGLIKKGKTRIDLELSQMKKNMDFIDLCFKTDLIFSFFLGNANKEDQLKKVKDGFLEYYIKLLLKINEKNREN